MGKLDGKVAVITGGNSGIGLATVKLFLQEGAKVAFTGRRQEALDEVAQTLSGDFLPILANAANLDDNQKVFDAVKEKYGKADILFLNAGIAPFAPLEFATPEQFDDIFNTNVKGPYFATQKFLPLFGEGSVVIFNTSIVDVSGFPGTSIYSASKAAARSLVRVWAAELAEKGIRAVSVAPGPIETPIYGKVGLSEQEVQEMGAGFAQQVPLKRFGNSDEVANAVLFLASSDASFITGAELPVDGGIAQV